TGTENGHDDVPFELPAGAEQRAHSLTLAAVTGGGCGAPLKWCAVALLLAVLGTLGQALRLLDERVLVRCGEEQFGILISDLEPGLNPRTQRLRLGGVQLLLQSRDTVRRLLSLRLAGLLQIIELLRLRLEVVVVGELRTLPGEPVAQCRVQFVLAGDRLEPVLTVATLALLLAAFVLSHLFLLCEPPVDRRRPRTPPERREVSNQARPYISRIFAKISPGLPESAASRASRYCSYMPSGSYPSSTGLSDQSGTIWQSQSS